MLPPTRAAAAFSESRTKCAYRAVVVTLECPSSRPIIVRLSPSAKALEAYEWRDIVDPHVLEPGPVADALPMVVKVREMRIGFPARDHPRIALHTRDAVQHTLDGRRQRAPSAVRSWRRAD